MDGYWMPASTVIGTDSQTVQKSKEEMSVISQPTMVNFANIFAGATAAVASSATPNSDMLGMNGKNFVLGHGVPSLNQIGIPSANQLSKRSGVFPIAGSLPGMATISNIGMANANVIISGNAAPLEGSLPEATTNQLTFASAPQMTIAVSKDFIQQAAAESGVAMTLNNTVQAQIYTQQPQPQGQAEPAVPISEALANNLVTASLSTNIGQEQGKQFKCSQCEEIFTEENQLHYHIFITHSQLQSRPHRCAACPESFLEPHHLQDHIKAVHSNADGQSSRTFTCSECSAHFTHGGHLNYHIYMAHTVQGARTMEHMCMECGKTFMKANVLNSHIKNVHGINTNLTTVDQAAVQVEEEKQYACADCDKIFKVAQHLKQHVVSVHQKPHKCEKCEKAFGRRSDLNRHTRGVHMRERPHSCAKCGWTFAEAGNLKHHMQAVHSKEKNHRCYVCSKSFSIAAYLKTHMMRTHGIVDAPKTGVIAAVSENQAQPQQQVQPQQQAYLLPSPSTQNVQTDLSNLQVVAPQSQVKRCFECCQIFANAAMLQNHVMSTHSQPFWCTVCGEGFSQAFQLQSHLQLRHSDSNNIGVNNTTHPQQQQADQGQRSNTMTPAVMLPQAEAISQAAPTAAVKCNDCGLFLEKDTKSHVCSDLNKQAALTAAAAMAMAEERPHLCTKCGKGFKTATHLKQHVRCVHTKDRPHKCQLCSKRFARMSDLNRHVKSVHQRLKSAPKALRLMNSKCTECNAAFPEAAQLKRHILTIHLNQRPCFKCADCQEGFPDEMAFKNHICHESERPHRCSVCTKRFAESTQLRRHIRSAHGQHASQQQHKCFECNRNFTRPVDLDRHIHAVHLKEKPHKCQYCGKFFGLHGNLNKHIRAVHMLEKPHQCVECGKCFAHIGVLKRHLRDIHYYDRRPAQNNPRLRTSATRNVADQTRPNPEPEQQPSQDQEVNPLTVLQALEAIQQQEQQQQQQLVQQQSQSVQPQQQQQSIAHVPVPSQTMIEATPQPPHTPL